MRISKRTIHEALYDLNIRPNCTGFQFISDAVSLILETPDLRHQLTTSLYVTIAKKHNTTSSKVERAIRSSIAKSNIDHEWFIPFTKLTNGLVLAVICQHLIDNEEDSYEVI